MRALVLAALAVAWAAHPAAANDPVADDPMTNEDVVRALVSGAGAGEVIEEIRSRPVAFDLSEDMVRELEIAGVPDAVIRAMRERQRATQPARSRVPAAPSEADLVTLGVRLDSDRSTGEIVFPERIGKRLARALGVGAGEAERAVSGLAMFLACRSPRHVPDYWRGKSPLGRDFTGMPRHRMLAFHPRTTPVERASLARAQRRGCGSDRCYRLSLPDSLETRLRPGRRHDLMLGLAVRVGDRYRHLASVEREDVAVGPSGAELDAWIVQEGPAVEIEFESPPP